MSPYGMGDTLHILPLWVIQVKHRGPAVPLKAMMIFLIHHYVYFYGFYLFFKLKLAKKPLQKQIGTLI